MKPRKKLIEVSIPLEAINVASAKEKSIRHGHPSTLHLWWARRPLAACRAVLFAQLVDDPSSWPDRFPTEESQDGERRRLHKIIEAMVPWETSNDDAILNAARWEIARSVAWGLGEEPPAQGDSSATFDYLQTKAPPVYDPFSGGGSIPLEAQRLGLRAYGSDLNPVAVLIGKALVEIPPKFAGKPPVNPNARLEAMNGQLRAWKGAQGLAEDVRFYGQWMRDEAERRIGKMYPAATRADGSKSTVIAWLWARTVRSPDPAAKGAMVPLISSFIVSNKEKRKVWLKPVIDQSAPGGYRFTLDEGLPDQKLEAELSCGTKSGRGTFTCILTGASLPGDYVKSEFRAGRSSSRLMCMVVESSGGRQYLPPDPQQESAASVELPDIDAIAQDVAKDPRALTPILYSLDRFDKLFTNRQLVALTTFSDLVAVAREIVLAQAYSAGFEDEGLGLHEGGAGAAAYADAIATYLAFAVDKAADRNTTLCAWETKMDRMRNTFGRQALSMVWDFTETNPLSGAGGDIAGTAVAVFEVLSKLNLSGQGYISNINAGKNSFPIRPIVISTDPPYYDNIGYADLSDFFYVWLRRSLAAVWPDLFRRLSAPKEGELVALSYRHKNKDEAEAYFMHGMGEALAAMRKAATDPEPLTIYYAFKQSELVSEGIVSAGWASFLQAVVDAGLVVDGTWPIRTELASRMRGIGSNALASSIVLVCRKRTPGADVVTRADFIRTLKREMPAAIAAIRKAGVGPVDMQQSVIGPGMGVFSRNAKVLEDDDSPMGVRTALAVINRVWEEIENELDQAFDAETQVALAWFATYGFDARASGELITLTTAKNTSDRALFASGVFKDMKGKTALTPREELPPGWTPAGDRTLTTWECVQHTARVLNAPDGGGEAAAALVAQMGPKAEEARALAYRLFEIATNKGWATEALVYNELAQEWSKLEEFAAALDNAGQAPSSSQAAFEFGASV